MPRCLPIALIFLLLSTGIRAAPPSLTPYTPDAQTLHLWHLDDAAPPFRDYGSSNTPLLGLHHGATARQPSAPNLKSSVSFSGYYVDDTEDPLLRGAALTRSPNLNSSARDNAPPGFRYFGKDGSFTYEAIVKFDVLPSDTTYPQTTLLSMDGPVGSRIFSLRIEQQGTLAFIPLPDCGASGGALASIPTAGPHAINTTDWFHIAVTYNGIENLTNNVSIYWTRLDLAVSEAHRIGSGTLTNDFNGKLGGFTIGNEATKSRLRDSETAPFPGKIDEVRISSIARRPRDFLFVPKSERARHMRAVSNAVSIMGTNELPLFLASVFVDGEAVVLPSQADQTLELEPGLHRLDFDFTYPSDPVEEPIQFRCQLEGIDESWRQSTRGMSIVCQVRDKNNKVISEAEFDAVGSSKGWGISPQESDLTSRAEPLFIPPAGRFIYIQISSGSPDTTGNLIIDKLSINLPEDDSLPLWQNGDFSRGANLDSPQGTPIRWNRLGSDPSIAQVSGEGDSLALAIADGSQADFGRWACLQPFDPIIYSGRTVIISWEEAYNVISGSLQRATYVNVPPGKYTFRAIALASGESSTTGSLELRVNIRQPFWQQPWFPAAVASGGVALLALYFIRAARRRARRRIRELGFQHALERDRTRIARDMHDDLGTRITVLNLTASMALREMDRAPDVSRRQLNKLTESARELVVAMDDLVWAVDPAHDSLDQLASHITRLSEEMFRDSPIRCRLDIPAILPARQIGSDVRHQISLSVKEALHNVLRHAGPCEVRLSLQFNDERLTIVVHDTGVGFETEAESSRHGLEYLSQRLNEIGGSCTITSTPEEGSTVRFEISLPSENSRP